MGQGKGSHYVAPDFEGEFKSNLDDIEMDAPPREDNKRQRANDPTRGISVPRGPLLSGGNIAGLHAPGGAPRGDSRPAAPSSSSNAPRELPKVDLRPGPRDMPTRAAWGRHLEKYRVEPWQQDILDEANLYNIPFDYPRDAQRADQLIINLQATMARMFEEEKERERLRAKEDFRLQWTQTEINTWEAVMRLGQDRWTVSQMEDEYWERQARGMMNGDQWWDRDRNYVPKPHEDAYKGKGKGKPMAGDRPVPILAPRANTNKFVPTATATPVLTAPAAMPVPATPVLNDTVKACSCCR